MESEMTLALPRFVAIKAADSGLYLCVRQFRGRPHLQFTANDISDPTVTMEILAASGGNVRIRHTSSGKLWNLGDPDFILADADGTSDADDNRATLFRPFKLNSKSIGLLNLSNNQFCRRFTQTLISGLNANSLFTTLVARLMVEEPVTKRDISTIKYNLHQSRVYDNETVVLVENSAINRNPNLSTTVDLTLSYKDVWSNIWKTNLLLKLDAKATFRVESFPIIVNGGKVESFNQLQELNELDETLITITIKEVAHRVVVPPMTKVVVRLIATKGTADVPFTFTQTDTLINGDSYTTEVEDATYTVSNYYNLEFKTEQVPVDA
ncbi:hypothetical protein F3Y22_tig00110258pilonHSYRG00197 [Hibiscus syriacus]|uniref:Agglutinin domain-containing protein n=1 Tax=Hibiscus syriacus TaxID=106335 RepID=A0A6A3B7P6_HIBSY|nr:uncharacterized protein LOC120115196 [Hibiscus syriacus]KAE8712343.1 hypothetical protein F3Y22_tig00110258pilonHSYRG00197 [Hibiscus syriacus]